MRKSTKGWLVIAASLILAGCVIFVGVMTVLKWNFAALSTVKMITSKHEISVDFSQIAVETDTAHVLLARSEDETCRVDCYEEEKAKHAVSVENDTLFIRIAEEKAWYDYIGINFRSPTITVYLPKTVYMAFSLRGDTGAVTVPKDFEFERVDLSSKTGDIAFSACASGLVKIQTNTGDIRVTNASVGALDLTVSTGAITATDIRCQGDMNVKVSAGKTKLTDVTCRNLTSQGSTGNVSLTRVIAEETFSIQRSTGDVTFDGADAAEILVSTDTGDVKGSLLTEKIFTVQTDTGRVNVPQTAIGGKCNITTDTGDIKIQVT